MNYIELIKSFWHSHEAHSFSTTEIALYFHLLEICNSCHWQNPFKRRNNKIEADLNISFNTLKNARNKLAQCNLITFKSSPGVANVTYTLSKFDEVTNKVSHEVKRSSDFDEVTKEVGIKVSSEVPIKVSTNHNKNENKNKNKKEKEEVKPLVFPYHSEKFLKSWEQLLKTPKWKKKLSYTLQLALNKLKEFEEDFAIELIEQATIGQWQGLIYQQTKEDYQKWLKSKGKKPIDNKPETAKTDYGAKLAKQEEGVKQLEAVREERKAKAKSLVDIEAIKAQMKPEDLQKHTREVISNL